MTEEVIEYSVKRLLVSSSQNRCFLMASWGDAGADLSPASDSGPAELQSSLLPSSLSTSSHSLSSSPADSLEPTGHKSAVKTPETPTATSHKPRGHSWGLALEEAELEMVLDWSGMVGKATSHQDSGILIPLTESMSQIQLFSALYSYLRPHVLKTLTPRLWLPSLNRSTTHTANPFPLLLLAD